MASWFVESEINLLYFILPIAKYLTFDYLPLSKDRFIREHVRRLECQFEGLTSTDNYKTFSKIGNPIQDLRSYLSGANQEFNIHNANSGSRSTGYSRENNFETKNSSISKALMNPIKIWCKIKERNNFSNIVLIQMIASLLYTIHLFTKSLIYAMHDDSLSWPTNSTLYLQVVPVNPNEPNSRRVHNLIMCFATMNLLLRLESIRRLIFETIINSESYARPNITTIYLSQIYWFKCSLLNIVKLTIFTLKCSFSKDCPSDYHGINFQELVDRISSRHKDDPLVTPSTMCKVDKLFYHNLIDFDEDFCKCLDLKESRRKKFPIFVPYPAMMQSGAYGLALVTLFFCLVIISIIDLLRGSIFLFKLDIMIARNETRFKKVIASETVEDWSHEFLDIFFFNSSNYIKVPLLRQVEYSLFGYHAFLCLVNCMVPGIVIFGLLSKNQRIFKIMKNELVLYHQICRYFITISSIDTDSYVTQEQEKTTIKNSWLTISQGFSFTYDYSHDVRSASQFLKLRLGRRFFDNFNERIYLSLDLVEIVRLELNELKFWSKRIFDIFVVTNCVILALYMSVDDFGKNSGGLIFWRIGIFSISFTTLAMVLMSELNRSYTRLRMIGYKLSADPLRIFNIKVTNQLIKTTKALDNLENTSISLLGGFFYITPSSVPLVS